MNTEDVATPSEIKFRVLDTVTNKILRDSSAYHATIERHDGVATVVFNRFGLRELLFTGIKSAAGTEVFDGDLVEVTVDKERITDEVHWRDGAWFFGNFGPLSAYQVMAVVGNRFESPWPLERPAV